MPLRWKLLVGSIVIHQVVTTTVLYRLADEANGHHELGTLAVATLVVLATMNLLTFRWDQRREGHTKLGHAGRSSADDG